MKKIFKIILIILVICFISSFLFIKWSVDGNTKVYTGNEKILASKASTKKALIIYQPSRTSLTSNMANTIGERLNKFGYEVTINNPSEKISSDIDKYEVVVFGTPIYAGQSSPVLESYIKKIKNFSGKRILIFATCADKKDTKAIDHLEGLIKAADKIEKIKLLKDETEAAIDSVDRLLKE